MAEWEAIKAGRKIAIASDDFKHDVLLYVSGDFEDEDQALEYAGMLASKLNRPSAKAVAVDFVDATCKACDAYKEAPGSHYERMKAALQAALGGES